MNFIIKKIIYLFMMLQMFGGVLYAVTPQVSASYYGSFIIKSDGTLWAWGENSAGQLGDGTTIDRHLPVQIGSNTNWQSLSSGGAHTLAIKSDGTLWAWGGNYGGALGDGTTTNRDTPTQIGSDTTWQTVSAGIGHSFAIKSDGTLWAWGSNSYYRLGDGTNTDRYAPIQIGSETWKTVSAGEFHTLAIHSDGTLWAWGGNTYGQLGDGGTTNGRRPYKKQWSTNWQTVSAGINYSMALKSDGTLWAWGWNVIGQLGDGTTIDRHIPVEIGSDTNWQTVHTSGRHTLAIKSDGTLWAWGYNLNGQLGDGTTIDRHLPVEIGSNTNWQTVYASTYHSLALKSDDTYWAWGSNGYFQLGNGNNNSINSHLPTAIINPNCVGDQTIDHISGVCINPSCIGDQTVIGGVCIDPTCIGDQTVVAGVCSDPTCIGDQILTNGVCVNPTCIGNQTLSGGTCYDPSCIGDQTVVGGVCINPTCIGDQTLSGGTCYNPSCIGDQTVVSGMCTDPTCIEDETLVNGVCTDPISVAIMNKTTYFFSTTGIIGDRNYVDDGTYTGNILLTDGRALVVNGTYDITGKTLTLTRLSPSSVTFVLTYVSTDAGVTTFDLSVNGEVSQSYSFDTKEERDAAMPKKVNPASYMAPIIAYLLSSPPKDTDNDGISDADEINNGTDPFLRDTDDDGIDDAIDSFPLDQTEFMDTDEDGIGNNADTDDDDDGIPDTSDFYPLNADEDTDSDDDGTPDVGDVFPNDPTETGDIDGDGIGDNADTDDDMVVQTASGDFVEASVRYSYNSLGADVNLRNITQCPMERRDVNVTVVENAEEPTIYWQEYSHMFTHDSSVAHIHPIDECKPFHFVYTFNYNHVIRKRQVGLVDGKSIWAYEVPDCEQYSNKAAEAIFEKQYELLGSVSQLAIMQPTIEIRPHLYKYPLTSWPDKNVTFSFDETCPMFAEFSVTPFEGVVPLTVTVDASASVGNLGSNAYAWETSDGQTATGLTATFVFTTVGTYTIDLTITDINGITDTVTKEITVDPLPNAAFTTALTSVPNQIKFNAVNSTGREITYQWTTSDGQSAMGQNVKFTFPTEGDYQVTLTVTDKYNNKSVKTKTVTATGSHLDCVTFDPVTGWGEEGCYLQGTIIKTGLWTRKNWWDSSTTFIETTTYDNGTSSIPNNKNGPYSHITYRTSGNITETGNYLNNEKDGVWDRLTPSDHVIATYSNGRRNGYYEEENFIAISTPEHTIGNYTDGEEDGTWTYTYPDGRILTITFDNGVDIGSNWTYP